MAALPPQVPALLDPLEICLQPRDAVANQAAVYLDLLLTDAAPSDPPLLP